MLNLFVFYLIFLLIPPHGAILCLDIDKCIGNWRQQIDDSLFVSLSLSLFYLYLHERVHACVCVKYLQCFKQIWKESNERATSTWLTKL